MIGIVGLLVVSACAPGTQSPANDSTGVTTAISISSSPAKPPTPSVAKVRPTSAKKSAYTRPVVAATPTPKSTPTPPPTHAAAPPAVSSAPSPRCYPLTNGGNCYEPGEYCRNSDHGVTGVAGDGETITCSYSNGWRWEPGT